MSVSVCLSVCLSVCVCVCVRACVRVCASARRRRPAEAQCTRSLGLGLKMCAVIPVVGQQTHGTTFRALKVSSQAATQGAESAVYDCPVVVLWTF